jgi:hypothetical protein
VLQRDERLSEEVRDRMLGVIAHRGVCTGGGALADPPENAGRDSRQSNVVRRCNIHCCQALRNAWRGHEDTMVRGIDPAWVVTDLAVELEKPLLSQWSAADSAWWT